MAWTEEQMCEIAAQEEVKPGFFINLGIGIPTGVPNHIDSDSKVTFQSENGMLGIGPFPHKGQQDADLINAGKQTISQMPESSFFDSAASFAMIRGGHVDLTILGALEVSENGDLANWAIPGKMIKGMGGAMDLVANINRVVVLMSHCSKNGQPKLVEQCSMPLTGARVVDRIITDLGVFDVTNNGLELIRLAEGVELDEVRQKTQCQIIYRGE